MPSKIYPRSNDRETVYLKSVISNPNIIVGDYTMYNDFVKEPKDFEKNNVLYHYPINEDKLIIGKFCSIACGAKFIFEKFFRQRYFIGFLPFVSRKNHIKFRLWHFYFPAFVIVLAGALKIFVAALRQIQQNSY